MSESMKSYELFLIFSLNLSEEARDGILNKFCDIIKGNGQIDKIDKWGKRLLAYEMKKQREGFYVMINFKSASEVPAEITRVAGITDGILRHLIVVSENEIQ